MRSKTMKAKGDIFLLFEQKKNKTDRQDENI